ncbi:Lysophospholipid acyltransferase 7 [Cichlidogyrus casuarinus]|uniref:Lysophospholipid acyltransferase 7 n=1 Tax=Cichlidogyrus casuarinus TaxID=1844966 RepID=A0ABD2PMW6_9PLAT
MVSAYWHGLRSGYYLSFATVPLALAAETYLENIIHSLGFLLPPGSLWIMRWLLKMRVFEYCAMGFLLLDLEPSLRYWASIHFCVHIALVFICIWGVFVHYFDISAPTRKLTREKSK